MLIGEIMELTPSVTAAENMANRLADRIRNIWLENRAAGNSRWEEGFFEDADGVAFLRGEEFPNLQAMDYIFKWWGNEDLDGLAGELEVLWKANVGGSMKIYKTTIRFAQRDFVQGNISEESKKREANRADFRKAFSIWQKLYVEALKKAET